MTRYKGYYIDKVNFNSKKDIDKFIKAETVKGIKRLMKQMDAVSAKYDDDDDNDMTDSDKALLIHISGEISLREHRLMQEFKMTEDAIYQAIFA